MTLAGINVESMPVFRMTHPAHIRAMTDAPFEAGKKLFHSRVLALGAAGANRLTRHLQSTLCMPKIRM